MGERTDYVDSIELRLHAQESLHSGAVVRSAAIHVLDPLPADPAQCELFMGTDAAQLADVLWETLPGGTIDALLIELMQRRASVLRVGLLTVQEVAGLAEQRREPTAGAPRDHAEATETASRDADTAQSPQRLREGVDEWVVSRHDWGEPDRCRAWHRGARCRRAQHHDTTEYPHAV